MLAACGLDQLLAKLFRISLMMHRSTLAFDCLRFLLQVLYVDNCKDVQSFVFTSDMSINNRGFNQMAVEPVEGQLAS